VVRTQDSEDADRGDQASSGRYTGCVENADLVRHATVAHVSSGPVGFEPAGFEQARFEPARFEQAGVAG
jgi:hypothetical protein